MAIKNKGEEQIDWNCDLEVQLFYAMRGHKPVGVNRHFQMACIHEKFRNSIQKDISSQQIWDFLDTMYDMAELHASEIIPFPNEETEFVLPYSDFGDLLKKDVDKEDDNKPLKSRESSGDEKESGHSSSKQSVKERQKEGREGDGTEGPKRKRGIRSVLHESPGGSKPGSPATPQPGLPPNKRRRIQ